MNVEDTVTLLCPVGVIAKRMNPNISEIGVPGEPFFWPEVYVVFRLAPSFSRSTSKSMNENEVDNRL